MNYPEVLGRSIVTMPSGKRSLEWFVQQPAHIRSMFWRTLAKFNPVVAAEYLRDNCQVQVVTRSDAVAVAVVAKKEGQRDAISRVFSKPLPVAGTVIGEMWPNGVNILLPSSPRYYTYSRLTPNWSYIGVTTYQGERVTSVSSSQSLACSKTRTAARRFVRNGARISAVTVELFKLRLEQVEMVGQSRRAA